MKRAVTACVALALLAAAPAPAQVDYPRVQSGVDLRFPRDHARLLCTELPCCFDPTGNPFQIALTVLHVRNISLVNEQGQQLYTRRLQRLAQLIHVAALSGGYVKMAYLKGKNPH